MHPPQKTTVKRRWDHNGNCRMGSFFVKCHLYRYIFEQCTNLPFQSPVAIEISCCKVQSHIFSSEMKVWLSSLVQGLRKIKGEAETFIYMTTAELLFGIKTLTSRFLYDSQCPSQTVSTYWGAIALIRACYANTIWRRYFITWACNWVKTASVWHSYISYYEAGQSLRSG